MRWQRHIPAHHPAACIARMCCTWFTHRLAGVAASPLHALLLLPPLLLPGRQRRHHQAQQEFEEKLAGVRSAVDAWLHRAQGSGPPALRAATAPAAVGATPPATATAPAAGAGSSHGLNGGAGGARTDDTRAHGDSAGGMQIASAALAALQAATAAKAAAGAGAGVGAGPAGTSAAAADSRCGPAAGCGQAQQRAAGRPSPQAVHS
jgi:hypothetical protein